jgi:hypothetical protein
MKTKSKCLSATTAALFIGMNALTALAQPYVPLKTAEEAKALPKTASIMMACGGCKTLKPVAYKNIADWFKPRMRHDCAGCGGKVFPMVGQTTGTPPNVYYQHRCTKCGDASAFLCARHH